MADASGCLSAANRAFRKMLSYTELELHQLTFLDLAFKEDRSTNLRLLREPVLPVTGCRLDERVCIETLRGLDSIRSTSSKRTKSVAI